MSNFYLCDYCDNCKQLWVWANEVDCKAGHDTAKVMHDGIEKSTDVCEHYERREGGVCTERT